MVEALQKQRVSPVAVDGVVVDEIAPEPSGKVRLITTTDPANSTVV